MGWWFMLNILNASEAGVDLTECVADCGAKYHHNCNNDNSNQNKNQRVLNQALTLFFESEQHSIFLLSLRISPTTEMEGLYYDYIKTASPDRYDILPFAAIAQTFLN